MKHTWAEIASGAGLGVLIGALLGLSSANVVSGVITALAATLIAFFGLSSASKDQPGANARIASFGFCAVIALILGLESRTHNWLGASQTEQVERWVAAGVSRPRAIDLVIFNNLGIAPAATMVQLPPKEQTQEGMLFRASQSECDEFEKGRFGNPELRRESFADAGGVWSLAAAISNGLPIQQIERTLDAVYTEACQRGTNP